MTKKKTVALLLYVLLMHHLKNPTLAEIVAFFHRLARRKMRFPFKTELGVKNLVISMTEKKILDKFDIPEKSEEDKSYWVGDVGFKMWRKNKASILKAADELYKMGVVCEHCQKFTFFKV